MRRASLLVALFAFGASGACSDAGPPSARECLERVAGYLDERGFDDPPTEPELTEEVGADCTDPSFARDLTDADIDEVLADIDPDVARRLRSTLDANRD